MKPLKFIGSPNSDGNFLGCEVYGYEGVVIYRARAMYWISEPQDCHDTDKAIHGPELFAKDCAKWIDKYLVRKMTVTSVMFDLAREEATKYLFSPQPHSQAGYFQVFLSCLGVEVKCEE